MQKTIWEKTQLGGGNVPLEIVQNFLIRPYEQVVYAQPRIHHREWEAQTTLGF